MKTKDKKFTASLSAIKERPIISIIYIIVALGVPYLLNYIFLPAWNIHSGGFWCYVFIVFIFETLLSWSILALSDYCGISFLEDILEPIFVIFAGLSAVWIIFGIITSLHSSVLFRAKSYSDLVTIEEGDFSQDIQTLSTVEEAENFSLLDIETASRLGNRTLSELKKVSQYEVTNEYNLISYGDKKYRISPLEYSGIFSAFNNESIPGYVMVDSESKEANFIESDEIKYAPSAIFSKDLKRHLRKEYPTYIFDKFQFDIDDSGKPYYIAPVLKSTIGLFGGKMVDSFVVVNATTGDCEEYSPEDLPKWIDHAYSLDYLMSLAEYNYKYSNGFWNTWFSKKDVKYLSYSYKGEQIDNDNEDSAQFQGYNSLSTSDGVQFFTCVVSASNDESALGFILANSRTGEIKFYDCNGAEESSAQVQAESLYQNYGYTSSYPLIVNVQGVPTYAITLKDKSKIDKAYALINVENYTIASSGETLESAFEDYIQKISGDENVVTNSETDTTMTANGIITELYQVSQDGTTQFLFMLSGDENLYISSLSNNSWQVRMTVGTQVSIEYHLSESENGIGVVSKIEF